MSSDGSNAAAVTTLKELRATNASFSGNITAASYADNSDSPDSLADAYEIVLSHETIDGRVDHSKLSPKVYGKRIVEVKTGLIVGKKTRVISEAVMDELGEEVITPEETVTEDIEEVVKVEEPDPTSRNISMTISAQALIIQDLLKRIEKLEGKK